MIIGTERVVKVRVTDHLLLLFALTLRGPSGAHCVELQFHPSFTYFLSAMTLRGPSGGHCVELQFHPSFSYFPSAMTLRGPSGGHCEGLPRRESQTRWGPEGPQAGDELHLLWPSPFKLHAVAPGGPPEGHLRRRSSLLWEE